MICSELCSEDCDFVNGAAYIADFLLAFHPAYAERGRSSEKPSSRVNPVNSGWSHRLLRCIVQWVQIPQVWPSRGMPTRLYSRSPSTP